LAVGILLLSVGLFLVLPRVLGRTPASPLRAELSVGFASEVDLGLTGSLEPDYTPVMRIEPLSGSVEGLRWRGVALRSFNGTRWTNPPPLSVETIEPESGRYALPQWFRRSEKGHRIRYRVTLEPLATNALFLAGLPEQISGTFRALLVSDTDTLSTPTSGLQPLRYEVYSWISERQSRRPAEVSEFFTDKFHEKYLQLPRIDPRIRLLTDQITAHEVTPLAKAEALESYLRTQYGYTLDLPAQRVEDPLAHFLFERKEGHCEYFASAMTVMLRSVGIASRLVNGFVGGIHNPVSGLHVVRSRDAHSWVEAYIPRYGWLEFDPTPPDPRMMSDPWLAQAWMYWDAVQSFWSEWVLDYDVGHQIELARAGHNRSRSALSGLVFELEDWFDWATSLGARLDPSRSQSPWEAGRTLLATAGALAVALFGGTWLIRWGGPRLVAHYRRRRIAAGRARPSDCLYFYTRALEVLRRNGLQRNRWQTPEEFAQSIDRTEYRSLMAQITAAYNAARFGRDSMAEKSLPVLVAALERARP
jgi:transglutaminase-like putative cysteine protease